MIFMWVTIVVLVTFTTLLFYKWRFRYWAKRRVPFIKPRIPFGSLLNPFTGKKHLFILMKDNYDYYKSRGYKYGGLYIMTNPVLLIIDLQLQKNIMGTDFNYFTERGFYFNEKHDPISANLFTLGGATWKARRAKINPAFTPGKVKMMFPTMLECTQQMNQYLNDRIERGGADVDVKMLIQYLSTDIIASCAFGLEPNRFKDSNSEFVRMCNLIFETSLLKRMTLFFADSFPELARKLGIRLFDKCVTDYFRGIVRSMIHHRDTNSVERNDLMQILMSMRKDGTAEEGLTLEQISAESFLFFGAGFDTSSSTMIFALFELAHHQDIQERLRKDICKMLQETDNQFTYEAVNEMKYLAQIIDETLRKYPPAGLVTRECVTDYKVADSDLVIERGMKVLISVYSHHHDPEYFPEPNKFDPERFSDENRRNSGSYLPFGAGPRICVGLRFALTQVKLALSMLLSRYRIFPCSKTDNPVPIKQNSLTLCPEREVYLNFQKIRVVE